jgi:hypothetical protein
MRTKNKLINVLISTRINMVLKIINKKHPCFVIIYFKRFINEHSKFQSDKTPKVLMTKSRQLGGQVELHTGGACFLSPKLGLTLAAGLIECLRPITARILSAAIER